MADAASIRMKDVKLVRTGAKALSLQADAFDTSGMVSADTGNFRKGLAVKGKSIEDLIKDTIEGMNTHIVCGKGWDGFLCQQDEIDCLEDTCNKRGKCNEGKAGTGEYTCACDPGYAGLNCEKKCEISNDISNG